MLENYLLEQLVAFSEEKTLSKAAEKLHISQPALSNSMKKIENIIGVKLFNRTKNRIELNDTGKVAVKYAKQAIKSNHDILTKTREFANNIQEINLGSCTRFIENWTIPLIQDLYPTTKIQNNVQEDLQLIKNLKNKKYNLIVTHSLPDEDNFYSQHYFDEQILLTLRKSDPLAKKNSLSFQDLNGMTILAAQEAGFWLERFKTNIKNLTLLPQATMSSLDELVHGSTLPVFNSTRAIQDYPDPPRKVSRPISDPAALASYYLVCRKEDKEKLDRLFNKINSINL